jgi:membrane protein DedA with SNARE-associated domain
MELIAPLLEWIAANPGWAGLVLFLVAFFESLAVVGLVMPGAALMFGAGALMGTGHIDFWSGASWAIAGAIAGDGVSFWLGRHFGTRLAGVWPFRKNPLLLERGVHFFRMHGGKSVLLGRFVGPIRPVIPAVAGMLEMPPLRFFLVNVFSACLWAPAYLLPGMVFAASLSLAAAVMGRLLLLIALVLALLWVAYIVLRQLLGYLGPRLPRARRWFALAGVLLLVPAAVLSLRVHALATAELPPAQSVPSADWQQDGWDLLPGERQGLARSAEPFRFQWAGTREELTRALDEAGFVQPDPPGLIGALRWLSPEPDLLRLHPTLRWHADRLPDMVWVQPLGGSGQRLVLRLWQAPLMLSESAQPVWLAAVEREEVRRGALWSRRSIQALSMQDLSEVTNELASQRRGSLLPAPGVPCPKFGAFLSARLTAGPGASRRQWRALAKGRNTALG